MRLIDADQLCEEFKMRQRAALNWKEGATLVNNEESIIRADATLAFLSEVKLTIDKTPTVTPDKIQALLSDYLVYRVEPQRSKGEWKENVAFYKGCSECGAYVWSNLNELYLNPRKLNFCPNCGADMRGEEP